MPKISQNAYEQSTSPFSQAVEQMAGGQITQVGCPMLLCGVNRKVNIGNYENLDVYAALSVPVMAMPDDLDAFKAAVEAAADLGFGIVSEQTYLRYQKVKAMQQGGRSGK